MAASVIGRQTAVMALRSSALAKRDAQLAGAASNATMALQAMDQPAAMPGLAVDLRQREWEFSRG